MVHAQACIRRDVDKVLSVDLGVSTCGQRLALPIVVRAVAAHETYDYKPP